MLGTNCKIQYELVIQNAAHKIQAIKQKTSRGALEKVKKAQFQF